MTPSELVHLDGYDIHNERLSNFSGRRGFYSVLETDRPYRLVTKDGRAVDFNSRTSLALHTRDGRALPGPYLSMAVDSATFQAVTPNGPLKIALADVLTVETKNTSPSKTFGLIAGIGGGVLLTAIGVTLGVILTRSSSQKTAVP